MSKKIFDNLNNLYKRLSILALEQQQQLVNPSITGNSNTLQSISSTSTTISRHGSIFYDAPEALSMLVLNEDKDDIEKMVDDEFYLSFVSLYGSFVVRFGIIEYRR